MISKTKISDAYPSRDENLHCEASQKEAEFRHMFSVDAHAKVSPVMMLAHRKSACLASVGGPALWEIAGVSMGVPREVPRAWADPGAALSGGMAAAARAQWMPGLRGGMGDGMGGVVDGAWTALVGTAGTCVASVGGPALREIAGVSMGVPREVPRAWADPGAALSGGMAAAARAQWMPGLRGGMGDGMGGVVDDAWTSLVGTAGTCVALVAAQASRGEGQREMSLAAADAWRETFPGEGTGVRMALAEAVCAWLEAAMEACTREAPGEMAQVGGGVQAAARWAGGKWLRSRG